LTQNVKKKELSWIMLTEFTLRQHVSYLRYASKYILIVVCTMFCEVCSSYHFYLLCPQLQEQRNVILFYVVLCNVELAWMVSRTNKWQILTPPTPVPQRFYTHSWILCGESGGAWRETDQTIPTLNGRTHRHTHKLHNNSTKPTLSHPSYTGNMVPSVSVHLYSKRDISVLQHDINLK
jgi:hypothetical protein